MKLYGNQLIAVIMPVRNGMPLIKESIDSIRAQDYSPLEIVIVDDASTDGTRDYLHSMTGVCLKVLELDGKGPSAARNAGIRATKAALTGFLDADDLWPPGTLRALSAALLENPAAGFAQGMIRNFRANSQGNREVFTPPYRFLNLGASLWRRAVFEKVGGFDEGLRLCEDLDFLMRCWENDIRKAQLDQVTLLYRRHPGNMTHGLSGAGFGTVAAFKQRIERVRKGLYDPAAPRLFNQASYMGSPPPHQDRGFA